jgi:hypothetical protein
MKVSDLLEQLSEGELRQVALGGSESSGIIEADYPKVIPHINLGLMEIYKRFPIKTKQLTIQQEDHIQEYILHPDYAETNTASAQPIKYIKDSVFKPFTDGSEVLKIESVFKENGEEYHLNDENNAWSLFTPSHNTIQVPYALKENSFVVSYRAPHPKLESKGPDVLNQEIEISYTYLQPLLLFIASRYLSTRGNVESSADGAGFLGRFEQSILDIQRLGLSTQENTQNLKLEINRWD